MANQIEILDSLPGTGKTYAIFDYMAKHRNTERFIYVSPMKKEINERVATESERAGIEFFVATERDSHEEMHTKTLQVLDALHKGENIACTHNLLLRFTEDHLMIIELSGYIVICDEELELISAYNELKKGDVTLLLKNNSISIDDETGKIKCLDPLLAETKYAAFKRYADFECLYASVTRNEFLVIQISPKVIHLAKRFILLTYNYPGSVMDAFMQMNGITHKKLDGVVTRKSSEEVIKRVSELVTFIETPSVKKWQQKKNVFSVTWWNNSVTDEDIESLGKVCNSIMNLTKSNSEDTMITLPKANTELADRGYRKKVFTAKRLKMEKAYVVSTARATNDFMHKRTCIHMYNLYPNQAVRVYLQDRGFFCDPDTHALNTFIQWLFRSQIRDDKPIDVAILSARMSSIFKEWLMQTKH